MACMSSGISPAAVWFVAHDGRSQQAVLWQSCHAASPNVAWTCPMYAPSEDGHRTFSCFLRFSFASLLNAWAQGGVLVAMHIDQPGNHASPGHVTIQLTSQRLKAACCRPARVTKATTPGDQETSWRGNCTALCSL